MRKMLRAVRNNRGRLADEWRQIAEYDVLRGHSWLLDRQSLLVILRPHSPESIGNSIWSLNRTISCLRSDLGD